MNARLMKKSLKKKIGNLQSDNDLMRKIIEDTPRMQKLYDLYNRPLNVTHATMPVQEFKAGRVIPTYSLVDNEELIELTKQPVAEGLFDVIKRNITYEIDTQYEMTSITGTIFVGRKGCCGCA